MGKTLKYFPLIVSLRSMNCRWRRLLKARLWISFDFFQNTFFSKIWAAKFRVQLIFGCGLSAGFYGTLEISDLWTVFHLLKYKKLFLAPQNQFLEKFNQYLVKIYIREEKEFYFKYWNFLNMCHCLNFDWLQACSRFSRPLKISTQLKAIFWSLSRVNSDSSKVNPSHGSRTPKKYLLCSLPNTT